MMSARIVDRPEPGFFELRLVPGGPLVAARIWRPCPMHPLTCEPLDRYRPLCAEIDGAPASVERVWHAGRPIGAAAFAYLDARGRWARARKPDHPFANPRRPITWDTIPVLFP
jgi:hypothetical protein